MHAHLPPVPGEIEKTGKVVLGMQLLAIDGVGVHNLRFGDGLRLLRMKELSTHRVALSYNAVGTAQRALTFGPKYNAAVAPWKGKRAWEKYVVVPCSGASKLQIGPLMGEGAKHAQSKGTVVKHFGPSFLNDADELARAPPRGEGRGVIERCRCRRGRRRTRGT